MSRFSRPFSSVTLSALAIVAVMGLCIVQASNAPVTIFLPVVSRQPAPAGVFNSSTPIAIAPSEDSLWIVNPDAGSITQVNTDTGTPSAEIAVGREPWSLAIAPDGRRVYVVDRAAGSLVVVDAATRTVMGQVPVGPEPGGVVLSPDGTRAYVSVTAAADVVVIDTTSLSVRTHIAVESHPYGLAIGSVAGVVRLYVTHLLALPLADKPVASDSGHEGRMTIIDAATERVTGKIALQSDVHGFPNLLSSITGRGQRMWVPHVRNAPDLPNGLTTTVFAAVSSIDLTNGTEAVDERLDLNDELHFGSPVNNPVAVAAAPDGQHLYIVLAGSDLVEVVDIADPTHPRLVKFLPTGRNPQGIAVSADGRRGYVMNYLSRSVSVLDLEQFAPVGQISVTTETLDPNVLQGKILFNTAVNPRMARGSWMSCASCHVNGGTDGVTWMFPDGPRQTPPLWNATRTLPWHWSAALDEEQDVEFTIRDIQLGTGLLPGTQPPLLGTPIAGRSADLDALVAFLDRGIRAPAVPEPTPAALRGRQLFLTAGCATCHGGPHWTSSSAPGRAGTLDPDGNGMVDSTLRDVGTLHERDLRGATGFDPPSLFGVGLSAPYLHDGSMLSIDALLASGHPDPHGQGNGLTQQDIEELTAFVLSIGPDTPPIQPR